jgi:glycosyltransferase involved in cell wall biosynthesis
MTAAPFRMTFIITDLLTGGAELMLARLLGALDREKFAPRVIALIDDGPVGEKLRALGVPVETLGLPPGSPLGAGRAVLQLTRMLRAERPVLVQTWMYHADLLGGLAAKLAGAPVVWSIRNHALDPAVLKRSTRMVVSLCAVLSRVIPQRVVTNAGATAQVHIEAGYDASRMVVIPNGFDLEIFKPDPSARQWLRTELGLPPDTPLVGLAARFDPMKDHRSFARAAGLAALQNPAIHFVLFGEGVDPANPQLTGWLQESGAAPFTHLLGSRADVPRLLAALDVAALSSVGEAFSNVIAEAMACGVPCAVTDVGDSALIVGQTGRVSPPNDPAALAASWLELLALPAAERQALGAAARRRIVENYSLAHSAAQFTDLYETLIRR